MFHVRFHGRGGAWRTERPLYAHNLPPCNNACPAVMGRVCYRPCETACNRAQLDSAVGISSVEPFLGDEALRRGWQSSGRRGAGGMMRYGIPK
jgi:NADPH-dependent glutamate synthase beta subunit-like oxidoreductase